MAGAICFYENNNISINRITINKELNEKIKIVQLSDLHSKEFGCQESRYRKISARIFVLLLRKVMKLVMKNGRTDREDINLSSRC